jgi:nucleoside-diphosphate-sugar epimerase
MFRHRLIISSTGVTGYIGGDALYVFQKAHPEWEITCLVRNSDKGAKVAAQYPKIRLVYGELDSADLIAEEAKKADIVYHFANCDHEASAEAISKGLAQRKEPSYWIHTSGTLILGFETIQKGCYGQELPKVFNDWDGVNELINIPHESPHRVVDEIVLACSAKNSQVKTAIVCPCTIYGPGRGPDNQRSQQIYNAAKTILHRKKGFMPGEGQNVWHEIHVQDLSDLYLLLGEAAMEGGGKATWDNEGYYLAENGSFVWGNVFKLITQIAYQKGLIPSDEVESLPKEEYNKFAKHGHLQWGANSRGESVRGKKLLGWKPHRPGLDKELPDVVEGEAKALGMIQGHAAKVQK